MRFMFIAGGIIPTHKATAKYQIKYRATGKTAGIIAQGVSAECPSNMIVTSDGTLLLATGYGPMLRMRQNESRLSAAGVPSPTKPVLIATGVVPASTQPERLTMTFDYTKYGSLYGTFNVGGWSYTPQGIASKNQRVADSTKYYQSLLQFLPTESVSFNDASYSVNSNNPFLAQGVNIISAGQLRESRWKYSIVKISVANVLAPSSGQSITGRYQAFMRYVDKDGRVGDPSPFTGDFLLSGEPAIVYTNLEVPTDERVARRQIFRNEHGNSDVFYLDIDTDDLTSTELVSQQTDAQLKLGYSLPVFDDNGYNLLYLYGQPPVDKPYIAEFSNSVFAVGFRPYTTGNVSVTNGSTTITGIGTDWPVTFAGRTIVVGDIQATVVSVNKAAQTLEIERAWDGPTSAYEKYTIMPFFANSNLLNWTEPGYPEAWSIANALQLPEDGDSYTGLMVFANALWILKENSIYQFNSTYDPARDGAYKPSTNRGCVNQRCAINVQNVCLMLDRVGLHVFKGYMPRYNYQADNVPDHLSLPIGDLFRFEGSWLRLNWNCKKKCFWHGIHNKELSIARWFVTMQGDGYPRHAICFNYLRASFWVEEYPIPITSSALSNALSGLPILGGYGGKVYIPDRGALDLITGNSRFSVTESDGLTVTVDGTPPACTGIKLCITSGTGHGQERMILEQDGSELTVDYPFMPAPDSTSIVQIGGIKYYALSPDYGYARVEIENPQAAVIEYNKTPNDNEFYVKMYLDGDEENIRKVHTDATWGSVSSLKSDPDWYKVDLSEAGYGRINMDSWRERDVSLPYSVQLYLEGFSGRDKPVFTSFSIVGASAKPDLNL